MIDGGSSLYSTLGVVDGGLSTAVNTDLVDGLLGEDPNYFVTGYIDEYYFVGIRQGQADLTVSSTLTARLPSPPFVDRTVYGTSTLSVQSQLSVDTTKLIDFTANLNSDSALTAIGTKFILIDDGASLSAETYLYGPTADVYAVGSIILAVPTNTPILRTVAVIIGDLNA